MTWAGIAPSGQVWTLNPEGSFARTDWKFINGDASGVVDNLLVIALQGNPISPAAPSPLDVLTWDGTRWTPASAAAGSGLVHNLLSPTHTDTTTASPANGDIIMASGAPVTWAKFPVGQIGQSLHVNSSGLPEWQYANGRPVVIPSGSYYDAPNQNLKIIVLKPSGSPTTINLPSSAFLGQEISVKDGNGDGDLNNITIISSGNTIDGNTGVILSQKYQSYTFMWNNVEWNII